MTENRKERRSEVIDPQARACGRVTRYALIVAGSLCVAVGAIGVVVPLLPTTPFLLLGAACYIRSSPRFYRWLIENRVLGAYIRDYLSGAGVPARTKIIAVAMLWITIGSSIAFAVDSLPVRVLLVVIAVGVTAHIVSLPLRKP